ncbi:hypothetical protein F5Y00DRAFT_42638 [Daldinia vernicosa]|uniref:uncharacterized protein n=1 Tax=Daldinia vernicosa TaxID=114800 RepID=UPI002007B6F5|nr:uncharacterized protein F5Y00DRAFT_42638 [Daldinia vernicosa]KAI0850167.1 hypothetical protein F5Y00DRAFT_42638 [Daldinia vernicosa]
MYCLSALFFFFFLGSILAPGRHARFIGMQCFQNSLRQLCSALMQLHAPMRRYRSGGWTTGCRRAVRGVCMNLLDWMGWNRMGGCNENLTGPGEKTASQAGRLVDWIGSKRMSSRNKCFWQCKRSIPRFAEYSGET